MERLAIALGCALVAVAGAHAQGAGDPLASPQCLAARRQLDEALAAGGPAGRLNAARRQAALLCLGRTAPAPPEGRFVPPPVAVSPIAVPSSPPAAPPGAPPPPLALPRPPVLTACDATGCWDSDGARYNQQGPVLLGPRGVCTLQAGVLNCP